MQFSSAANADTGSGGSTLEVGASVSVTGLKNNDLNGKKATVQRWDVETSRWQLQIEGLEEPRLIKTENIQLDDGVNGEAEVPTGMPSSKRVPLVAGIAVAVVAVAAATRRCGLWRAGVHAHTWRTDGLTD